MLVDITLEQGLKVSKASEKFRKAQRRYFAAIVAAVPEVANYSRYFYEIEFRWFGPMVEIETADVKGE